MFKCWFHSLVMFSTKLCNCFQPRPTGQMERSSQISWLISRQTSVDGGAAGGCHCGSAGCWKAFGKRAWYCTGRGAPESSCAREGDARERTVSFLSSLLWSLLHLNLGSALRFCISWFIVLRSCFSLCCEYWQWWCCFGSRVVILSNISSILPLWVFLCYCCMSVHLLFPL